MPWKNSKFSSEWKEDKVEEVSDNVAKRTGVESAREKIRERERDNRSRRFHMKISRVLEGENRDNRGEEMKEVVTRKKIAQETHL